MKRNFFMLVVTAVLCGGILAGCGKASDDGGAASGETKAAGKTSAETIVKETEQNTGAEQTAEKMELTIAWWGNDQRAEVTQKALSVYTGANPTITFSASPASWDAYWERLATQAAGGGMPTLPQMDYVMIGTYAKNNTLVDLQKFIDDGTIDVSNIDDELIQAGIVDGKLLGIPISGTAPCLMYNPDVLAEAGLEAPEPDWTWNDFYEMCKTVNKKTGKVGFAYNNVGCDPMKYWIRQYGYQPFNADNTALGYEDNAPLLDFFTFYKKMYDDGAMVSPDEFKSRSSQPTEAGWVPTGDGAFTWSYYSIVNQVKGVNDNCELITPPIRENGQNGLWIHPGMFWSISVTASEAEQEAAAEFINWFINADESNSIVGVDRGISASSTIRNKYLNGEIGNLSNAERKMFEYYDLATTMLGDKNNAYPVGYFELEAATNKICDQLLYGEITPEEAAETYRKEADKILIKNNAE